MQPGDESTPTYSGNDGTTEEEGRGPVPAGGEVGRNAAHVQTCLNRSRHSLQGKNAIYLTSVS